MRATKTLTLAAMAAAGLWAAQADAVPVIYEPFADLSDTTLSGNAGGTGLSGNWTGNALLNGTSLSYGNLATSGGRTVSNPNNEFNTNQISVGSTLVDAGLMNPGATLWFSALLVNYADNPNPDIPPGTTFSNENRTYISLGTGVADGFDRIGGNTGSGYTIAVSKVSELGVTAQGWNDDSDGAGGAFRGGTTVAPEGTIFVVGKITWGEFNVTDDRFDVYLPGSDLVLGAPVSTVFGNLDQLGTVNAANAFDTLSFAGGRRRNLVPEVDEIRFGASYADVAPSAVVIPEPATATLGLLALGGLMMRRRRLA